MSAINWNDPAARLELLERIGVEAYNQAFKEHRAESIVVTVAGHAIRTAYSFRFGNLFLIGDTGVALASQADAEEYARQNPVEQPAQPHPDDQAADLRSEVKFLTRSLESRLRQIYTDWCDVNKISPIDAESLLASDIITDQQRAWLTAFVPLWDETLQLEDRISLCKRAPDPPDADELQ